MIKKIALVVCLLLAACSAQKPYTPKANSSEELAIVHAVKLAISPVLNNQELGVKINSLCVYDDYAHIAFTPTDPKGGEFNYDKTRYAVDKTQDPEDQFNDTDADAILHRIGGVWVVVAYGLRLHEPPAYMLDPEHWQDDPVYKQWPKQILACPQTN